jgi:hypothetical protein
VLVCVHPPIHFFPSVRPSVRRCPAKSSARLFLWPFPAASSLRMTRMWTAAVASAQGLRPGTVPSCHRLPGCMHARQKGLHLHKSHEQICSGLPFFIGDKIFKQIYTVIEYACMRLATISHLFSPITSFITRYNIIFFGVEFASDTDSFDLFSNLFEWLRPIFKSSLDFFFPKSRCGFSQ